MFRKIFKKHAKKKVDVEELPSPSIAKLEATAELLRKKENIFLRKIDEEINKAKGFSKEKNKRAALQCLKKKKLYEQQVEQIGNFQLRIHDQIILLESAKATTETVDALRGGAAAMKAIQKATKIDDLESAVNEINEQLDEMKQIQETLSAPIGLAADFDEDELDAELEELEDNLEETYTSSLPQVPEVPPKQAHKEKEKDKDKEKEKEREEAELAALQEEMSL